MCIYFISIFMISILYSCQNQIDSDPQTEDKPTTKVTEVINVVEEPTDIVISTDVESSGLIGIKWKLAGIVNTNTDEFTVLEPRDCERCYTLSFDTDSTATVWSASNIFLIRLQPIVQVVLETEALGLDFYVEDAMLFCKAIKSISSYDISKNEVKFYFKENKNYLLFKPNKL